MPFMNEQNKPLNPAYLKKLGMTQAENREREERIRIEVAKKMGILDAQGNPINPDDFEQDETFVPESVPPQREHENGEEPPISKSATFAPPSAILRCDVCGEATNAVVDGVCYLCAHGKKVERLMPGIPASERLEVLRILLGEWKAGNLTDEQAMDTVLDAIDKPHKYRME